MPSYRILDDNQNEITHLEIPKECVVGSELEGISIIGINDGAFANCVNLKTLDLDAITSNIQIGYTVAQGTTGAFEGCTSLDTIVFPTDFGTITIVGAFKGCTALTALDFSNITSGKIQLENSCLAGSGIIDIDTEDIVEVIGPGAFKDCLSLNSVITEAYYFGNAAFSGSSIKEITFNNKNITTLGAQLFNNCPNLDTINFNGTKAEWYALNKTDGWEVDLPYMPSGWEDGTYKVHCTDGDTPLIYKEPGMYNNGVFTSWSDLINNGDITVTNNTISAVSSNVAGELVVDDSVTGIGILKFYNNNNITKITLPDTITSIGSRAFMYMHNLQSINIPSSLTTIQDRVFYGCNSLTKLIIPASVTSIGDYAFAECDLLKDIEYLGTVAQFDLITIGVSITTETPNVLIKCSDGDRLSKEAGIWGIDNTLFKSISQAITDGYLKKGSNLWNVGGTTWSQKSYIILDSGTGINNLGFNDSELPSKNLYGVYIDPKLSGFNSIGNTAFKNQENFEIFYGTKDIRYFGSEAFYKCNLSSIDLYSEEHQTTSIYDACFNYNPNLSSVTFHNNGGAFDFRPSLTDSLTFGNCSSLEEINLPSNVSRLGRNMFYNSGLKSINVDSANNTLKSIDGVLYSKDGEYIYFYPPYKEDTEYTIENGVLYLGVDYTVSGDYKYFPVFYNPVNLDILNIPNTVTTIRQSFCFGIGSITTINYLGTMSEWNNITKGTNWNYYLTNISVIHCTDGDVTI